MRARLLLGFALVLTLGCGGGPKFVPVSGVVTLNNRPLANALVSFQPIAKEGSIIAGPGSQGKTNEKGEFTLTASTGEPGAVVGKHEVRISLLNQEVGEGDARPPRGGWPLADQVPTRYNKDSTLTCEVLAGGNPRVEFPLTSP